MASSSKKRQTFAKMTRERAVREKRELKLEKKRAAAEARRAGITLDEATPVVDETAADEMATDGTTASAESADEGSATADS
jgi:hypothetical protein